MTIKTVQVDLDYAPEIFERTVAVPDADHDPLRVRFVFKWRDRVEAATLFDQYRGAPAPVDDDDAIAQDIAALRDIAVGWNIAAPFDDLHLKKFFMRYPDAGPVLACAYRSSVLGDGGMLWLE